MEGTTTNGVGALQQRLNHPETAAALHRLSRTSTR